MRTKVCCGILTLLLALLLLRLCLVYNIINTDKVNNNHAILVRNHSSVKTKKDITKDKIHSKDKSYMKLYPDLYVDNIKPLIHIEEKKMAYLTFDDGPSSVTCDVLNTLNKYNAKATFFILGCTMTEEGEECLKAMVKQGHAIGIHTYSHDHQNIYSSVEAFLDDFYKDYQLIYEITGVKVKIFRFPWGSTNYYFKNIREELITEMERRGFTYYDWTTSGEDSVGCPTPDLIRKNIEKDLEEYSNPIILLHDSCINKLTAKTLPDIIDLIQEKGYEFDTLENREPFHW